MELKRALKRGDCRGGDGRLRGLSRGEEAAGDYGRGMGLTLEICGWCGVQVAAIVKSRDLMETGRPQSHDRG
ncbi:MAG: hypothetical protein U1F98_16255 [Verrucomicrobiota bacterium]